MFSFFLFLYFFLVSDIIYDINFFLFPFVLFFPSFSFFELLWTTILLNSIKLVLVFFSAPAQLMGFIIVTFSLKATLHHNIHCDTFSLRPGTSCDCITLQPIQSHWVTIFPRLFKKKKLSQFWLKMLKKKKQIELENKIVYLSLLMKIFLKPTIKWYMWQFFSLSQADLR